MENTSGREAVEKSEERRAMEEELGMRLGQMEDEEVAAWFAQVANANDAPDRRVGGAHEEDVIHGDTYCRECGFVGDIENPTLVQIYHHQDSFGEAALPLS